MLGIGSTELAIILLFAFLLFGPDKLPQAGRTIGRALRQFRETQEKLTNVVQTEVVDPMAAAAKAPIKKGAAASTDDDADLDVTASDAPRRKETFAERRARLAAEKAEAEAAAAVADAEAGEAAEPSEPEPAAAQDAPAQDAPAVEDAPAAAEEDAAAEPEAPAETTIEDLYARRPSRRAKREAADPEPADAAASDSEEGGER